MEIVSRRHLLYATRRHRRDAFVEFIRAELHRCFALYDKSEFHQRYEEVMRSVSALVSENRAGDPGSRLRRLVPTVGTFFTELDLVAAFRTFDAERRVSKRAFVPPTFNEIRHILNLSQIEATKKKGIKLVSFDGDQTLYADGSCITHKGIIAHIVALMKTGIIVAVVTAASYLDRASGYETRLRLLLAEFKAANLDKTETDRFYVLGGECNYLFQCNQDYGLTYIPQKAWQTAIFDPTPEAIATVLDAAQVTLEECVEQLGLKVKLIRRERAVGIVPNRPGLDLPREALDETAYALSAKLNKAKSPLPFCAFNGGNDVFVDIGDKSIGIVGLQRLTAVDPAACLHIGDQFLSHGNDFPCRQTCATIWITNPNETFDVLTMMVKDDNENGGTTKRARREAPP